VIKVYNDIEQGSAEWFKVRAGIPTASEFATVMMKGRGGGESKERRKYLFALAGERLTGECAPSFTNGHMERGRVMEDDARRMYAFMKDASPERVGFVTNAAWRAGASPDSFVGADGAIEIKTKLPSLHLACLEDDEVPEDHIAQCQGVLAITGRQWIDFVSYWPKLPLFVKRVARDEKYIATMKVAVQDFNAQLDAIVAKYQTREAA
jgi:hypothetical protein